MRSQAARVADPAPDPPGLVPDPGRRRLADRQAPTPRAGARRLAMSPRVTSSFMPTFDAVFAPRLAHRAPTFRAVLERLERRPGAPLILETGCARSAEPGASASDGQSTILFDRFVCHHAGHVISVDRDPVASGLAASLVSWRTRV